MLGTTDALSLLSEVEKENGDKYTRAKPKLTNKQKLYLVYFLLKFRAVGGTLSTGAKPSAVKIYDTSTVTRFLEDTLIRVI